MRSTSPLEAGRSRPARPMPLPPSRARRGRLTPLALALLAAGCDRLKSEPPPPPPPPRAIVAPVLVADVPFLSEYVGQTEAKASVDVRARVEGYITKIAFEEGSLVKEGDLLFELDKEPIEQRLLRAKAGLAEAKASQLKTQQDIARYKPLVEQRAIPRQDLENAEAAKMHADASIEAAQAEVRNAEIDLGYATIHAPVSGLIGDKLADIGDLVGGFASTPLATISPLDPIWFSMNVSEVEYLDAVKRAPQDKIGKLPVNLVLANGQVHEGSGKFIFIDRVVDSRTGTLRVRAEFSNPNGVLRPGQFARARVLLSTVAQTVLVPQKALQEIQGTYNVFTVDESGKAKFTRVEPGKRIGPLWVIRSGLSPGDRVVTDGLLRVRDGAQLTVEEGTIDGASLDELRKLIPK